MPTELLYLFLTSILLALLWIPHIIGQVRFNGPLQPEEYVTLREPATHDYIKRADRAHINLVEQFGAFGGLVVVAQLVQVSTALTAGAAAVFFLGPHRPCHRHVKRLQAFYGADINLHRRLDDAAGDSVGNRHGKTFLKRPKFAEIIPRIFDTVLTHGVPISCGVR